MGRIQDFLNTAKASGMSLGDAVQTLLSGSMDRPISLGEVFSDLLDASEILRVASAAARATKDLKMVSTALVEHGIHPLSLIFGGDSDIQRWATNDDTSVWRFHHQGRFAQADLYWGNLRLQRFFPTTWLRKLSPDLKFLFGPSVETLVFSDSCLTGLFHPDMTLDTNLTILACEGVARLPSRIQGRLQLHFSEARFQFPKEMDLDGILEIRGCPGIERLPDEIRTEGLSVNHCPNLCTLPTTILGARQIDLVTLPITSFPEGVEGVSYLRVAQAPNLEWLPLPSGNALDVELLLLLVGLQVQKGCEIQNFSVTRCDRLIGLPTNLRSVTGSLDLRHLPRLTSLPDGLVVGKDLRITDCPDLRSLPDGLIVKGEIHIQDCPHLKLNPRIIHGH